MSVCVGRGAVRSFSCRAEGIFALYAAGISISNGQTVNIGSYAYASSGTVTVTVNNTGNAALTVTTPTYTSNTWGSSNVATLVAPASSVAAGRGTVAVVSLTAPSSVGPVSVTVNFGGAFNFIITATIVGKPTLRLDTVLMFLP